jgi:hypothetical protein
MLVVGQFLDWLNCSAYAVSRASNSLCLSCQRTYWAVFKRCWLRLHDLLLLVDESRLVTSKIHVDIAGVKEREGRTCASCLVTVHVAIKIL